MTDPVAAGWRPSSALARAAAVGGVLAVAAVLFGRADLLVLAAPFLAHAALATVRRPDDPPRVTARLEHGSVREGEGTRWVVRLDGAAGVEHACTALTRAPWTLMDPVAGVAGARGAGPGAVDPALELAVGLASTRWGRRPVGAGAVVAHGPWAGHVWGPVPVPARLLTTLPLPGRFDSHAPVPHPLGLVGRHQSRRAGDGNELHSIRPFAPGDRLRRVRWPVSLRTGTLHVTSAVAEEDTAVLLLVDGGVDVGTSGGLDGSASSLDVAVRAAGAVAEHYLRHGDRVGLRVLGAAQPVSVPFGGGDRQLRRVLDTLARVAPGTGAALDASRLRLRVPPGTVVVVLSTMLTDGSVGLTRTLAHRGLDVVVVDTLPDPGGRTAESPAESPAGRAGGGAVTLESLAWRLRRLERDTVLARLVRAGVPVVAWRGPGTLDEVLRGLGRRGRVGAGARR